MLYKVEEICSDVHCSWLDRAHSSILFCSLRQLITDTLCLYRYNIIGNICILLYIIADGYLAHHLKEYGAGTVDESHLQLHWANGKLLPHGDMPAVMILSPDSEKKLLLRSFLG